MPRESGLHQVIKEGLWPPFDNRILPFGIAHPDRSALPGGTDITLQAFVIALIVFNWNFAFLKTQDGETKETLSL